jgi:hypothetical protein
MDSVQLSDTGGLSHNTNDDIVSVEPDLVNDGYVMSCPFCAVPLLEQVQTQQNTITKKAFRLQESFEEFFPLPYSR